MLNLEKVTLVTIDGVTPEICLNVLRHCQSLATFPRTLFLTYKKPDNWTEADDSIDLTIIPKFDSYFAYNQFCISDLYKYIDTEFFLIVQPDGFILNPEHWSDEFYNYDYIGAVFDSGCRQMYPHGSNVGNGGFCLRSLRFAKIVADSIHHYEDMRHSGLNKNEDFFLCKTNGDFLKTIGVKFAPEDVASKFSLESPYGDRYNTDRSFGFHGYHPWTNEIIEKVKNGIN